MPIQITVDDKKNIIYPHPKVLEAFADEKRGNNYTRPRTYEDDVYEGWVEKVKKNKVNLRAGRVIRTRTIIEGKLTEIIYFWGEYKGLSSVGNTQGRELSYFQWVGFYDEPMFDKHLDKEKDEWITDSVRDHIRRYEMPFNSENMQKVLEACDDATLYAVKETPETTALDIYDRDGFAKADFQTLLSMGRLKRTFDEIALLKTIQKVETQPVAEIAKTTVGESVTEVVETKLKEPEEEKAEKPTKSKSKAKSKSKVESLK